MRKTDKIPYPQIYQPNEATKRFKDIVIEITRQIPSGKVVSYGAIAAMAGFPRGARFVGGVLHFNAESQKLPWHRVVNRKGFISTSCFDHTRMQQKKLLEKEGVVVSADYMIDLDAYEWKGIN